MKFDKKKFNIYIIFTFVIGWILQVTASIFAIQGKMILFSPILSLAMFAPLVSVFISRIDIKNIGWKPQIKKNIKIYAVCWFAPALLTVLGAVLFFLIMPNRLDMSGGYLTAQLGEQAVQQLAESGITPITYVMIGLVQCITYAPAVNMIFALGEESGWRGVMYPMLEDKYGLTKGSIIGGIIWGVWHWPVMLLAGYEYGLVYWGAPFVGMALFCLFCVVGGILLDWVYRKTNSIWAPSIAHGAINAAASLPVILLNIKYANQMIIGPSPIGIVAMIPMIILAVIALKNNKK